MGWGLQSHFRVQPNNCDEVVLRCVVVGVVTIAKIIVATIFIGSIHKIWDFWPFQAIFVENANF